jgi:cell volume regulation protein A
MSNAEHFGAVVLIAGVTGVLALAAPRITARTRIPAPLIVLAGSSVVSDLWPPLHHVAHVVVEDIVTIALIYILFDGGLSIGWRRFREVAVPVSTLGVAGTFLTVAGASFLAHSVFGFSWFASLLLATAISPTDPAVVFSVLAGLTGKAMTVLAGESGANDPVGIALMSGLIAAGSVGWGPFGEVAWRFALQLGVGAAIGLAGGWLALWFARSMPMASPSLDALRNALLLLPIFGLATVAHGSGFLAVFIAGILFGDARLPAEREIHGFHEALASLGEIVAFLTLGLTVDVTSLLHRDVWGPGLIIAVAVAAVVRPVAAWVCMIGSSLRTNERAFVVFGGLKGAVPILLGTTIYSAPLGSEAERNRLFGIVVVVVVFSVFVQGAFVQTVAERLGLAPRRGGSGDELVEAV